MGTVASSRVLITAGPTWEMLDPVRFLSNRSSGQLGYALARVAQTRGARVTMISGPTALRPPRGVRVIPVQSAREMFRACLRAAQRADIIIMAAAVADYRPLRVRRHKLKKGRHVAARWTLTLVRNPDILATVCRKRRPGQRIIGFALESERLVHHARRKLRQKGCDIIIANAVPAIGARRHRATIIDRHGNLQTLPSLSKSQLATKIWSYVEHTL